MKRIYFLTWFVLGCVASLAAQDRLYSNDFDINAGETKTVEVILDNSTTFCALQTDLVLPTGLTVDEEGEEFIIDLTARKGRDHVISCNRLDNGAIRVFITSQNSRPFEGNSGAVFTIELTAANDFVDGKFTLTNSVAVEEDGTRHRLADSTARVNGGGGIKGDIDGNGIVDVSDLALLIDVVLGKRSADDLPGDCHVAGNSGIDVADVSALINIVLGK